MLPKVTAHELLKLRSKASLARITPLKNLDSVLRDANHLSKLILRRHGYDPKKYAIDFRDGSIIEKQLKGEDKVVAEVDAM